MKITICGSMNFSREMIEYGNKLEALGIEPLVAPTVKLYLEKNRDEFDSAETAALKKKYDVIRRHIDYIKSSDGILVLNFDRKGIANYIGANTFLEIGYAFAFEKDIFLLNDIPDQPIKDEILAMGTNVINGDLREILNHYAA